MAKYIEMTAYYSRKTAKAALLTFHEDTSDEEELWVPLSVIDNPEALDNPDNDSNVNILIATWFLEQNDISFDGCEEE